MISMLLESWRYPEELKSLYVLKKRRGNGTRDKRSIDILARELDDKSFCYAVLGKVSRSFAAVIQQLPEELRDAVCIFYLVLRGLDSIEDDTSVAVSVRSDLLKNFHLKHHDTDWSLSGVGDSTDYRLLLEHYPLVISAFQKLQPKQQEIILNICQQMGEGMAQYLDKEIVEMRDYDEYCGYVAGLVGIGLSQLFYSSGLESEEVAQREELSNAMGLFLQKTNIIRDFHEDFSAGRNFWPREVWGNYASGLDDFTEMDQSKANPCLNHLVTDALQHAADCLTYLKSIRDREVFRFCAIPQVMAIATLAKIYDDNAVFHQHLKIRKGLTAKLILQTENFENVQAIFEDFAIRIFNKIPTNDPNGYLTATYLRRLIKKKSKIREIDLFSKQRSMGEKHAMAS